MNPRSLAPWPILGLALLTAFTGCALPHLRAHPHPKTALPHPPPTPAAPPARSSDQLGFVVYLSDEKTLADTSPGALEYCVTRGDDLPQPNGWKTCDARMVASGLDPGEVTLRVRKAGFAQGARDLRLPIPGGRDVIVVLGPPRRTISGIVYLPGGVSVAKNARFAVTSPDANPAPADWQPTSSGKFEAGTSGQGLRAIHARLQGRPDARAFVSFPASSPDPVRLVLGRRDDLMRWTIADASRKPRAEYLFRYECKWRAGETWSQRTLEQRTDASGSAPIVYPAGCEEAVFVPETGYPKVTVARAKLADYQRYTLLPISACVVRGKVLDAAGNPPGPQCYVGLRAPGGGVARWESVNGEDGSYTFRNFAASRLEFIAVSSTAPPSQVVTAEFRGTGDLQVPTLRLGKPGRIVIALVGPSGPAKLPGSIMAFAEGRSQQVWERMVFQQSQSFQGPNDKGEFIAASLLPGKWHIQLDMKGCRRIAPLSVTTRSGETTRVKIPVVPLLDAKLRILTAQGKPLASRPVKVSWYFPTGGRFHDQGWAEVTPDAQGIAHLLGVDPDTDEVSVLCEAGAFKGPAPGLTSGKLATVRLQEPANVRGVITLLGKPWPRSGRGVCVVLSTSPSPPSYEPLAEGWDELGKKKPGDATDGRMVFEPDKPEFRFDSIPVGPLRWYLHLFAPDMVSAPLPVPLKPGETAVVALEAGEPATVTVRVTGQPAGGKGNLSAGLYPESAEIGMPWIPARRVNPQSPVFTVDDVPPGKWIARASYYEPDGGRQLGAVAQLETSAGQSSQITLALKPLKAVNASGKPASGN